MRHRNAGLASIPAGVNVIILRAAGEMSSLGWDDIRLAAEESDAIATLKAGKELGSETLSHLRRAADGWVAGLVLLLESLRLEEPDLQVRSSLRRKEIFGYFATELFDRSPHRWQARTSFLRPSSSSRAATMGPAHFWPCRECSTR